MPSLGDDLAQLASDYYETEIDSFLAAQDAVADAAASASAGSIDQAAARGAKAAELLEQAAKAADRIAALTGTAQAAGGDAYLGALRVLYGIDGNVGSDNFRPSACAERAGRYRAQAAEIAAGDLSSAAPGFGTGGDGPLGGSGYQPRPRPVDLGGLLLGGVAVLGAWWVLFRRRAGRG